VKNLQQDVSEAAWPEAIREYVTSTYGIPDAVTPLSGLSHNHVWQVYSGGQCVILKQSNEANEFRFYREIARQLITQGVAIPAIECSQEIEGSYWTIIEYMTKSFPREQWLAHEEQLRVLRNLHESHVDCADDRWIFRPVWDDAISESALSFFDGNIAQKLRPIVQMIQAQSQPLFEPTCWISGDPNPMNWGLREDESIVLFDWERFGRGTPAIDLAIATPGLATAEDCQKVAAVYLQSDSAAVENLARQIARAKVWNVVEYLYMAHSGDVAGQQGVESLVNRTPVWLENISRYAIT
jgi:aminoglycoside phosphotransferase (APT) family kinase protein